MNRHKYIDSLKGFAILLMVLCHTGLHNGFTQWVYAFHMPTFFLVSGFLFKPNKYISYGGYVTKKTRQLLIPFLLFALILCFGDNKYADWAFILYGSRNALLHSSVFTPLWFLPCFFLSTIIFRAVFLIRKELYIFIFLLVLGIIGFLMSQYQPYDNLGYPWSINVSLVGLLLMLIGYLLQKKRGMKVYGGGSFYSTRFGNIFSKSS